MELGSTCAGDLSFSSAATVAHTLSASATPPGAHTFEILLLITMACSASDVARRFLPTMIGAPGNAFFVNIAANVALGWSSAMSVTAILAGLSGSSRGRKPNRAVPTRNPRGSAA